MKSISKKTVTQQSVDEYLRNFPLIKNKGAAIGRAGKLSSEPAAGNLLFSVLDSQTSRAIPLREMESVKLANIDVKKRLASLGRKLSLDVKVGSQSRLDGESGALYLSPEGALAASVFAKSSGKSLIGKGTLMAAANLGAIPSGAGPKEIASALFLLHISEKGIDGALEDLFLGGKVYDWLAGNGRGAQSGEIRHALYSAQLKFAQELL